jgi:hypothetical protein
MRGNASAAPGRFQLAGQSCRSDHHLPRQRLRCVLGMLSSLEVKVFYPT